MPSLLHTCHSFELAGKVEWKVWSKEGMRPPNVPADPSKTYKHGGWQGWGHWLGTGNIKTMLFLPFDEALGVAHSLRLVSSTEWKAWRKEGMRPPNVPSHPDQFYKHGGWQGWGHWLGTGNTPGGYHPRPKPSATARAPTPTPGGRCSTRRTYPATTGPGTGAANTEKLP